MAAALATGIVTVTSHTAHAASADHVSASIWLDDDTPLTPATAVSEGQPLQLRISYSQHPTDSLAGKAVEFDFGFESVEPAIFGAYDAVIDPPDISANEAIESITISGGTVTVTFSDPWPTTIANGYFVADFTIQDVLVSAEETLSWKIDGQEQGNITLIVLEENDERANVSAAASKSVGTPSTSLNSAVLMIDDADNNRIFDRLDCAALNGITVPYGLTLNVPEGTDLTNYTITDVLPTGLDFVPASLTAALTSWDANGLNKTTDAAYAGGTATPTATGFTYTVASLAGPAIVELTFDAVFNLDAAECTALENLLRTEFIDLAGAPGNFSVSLVNTATFEGFDARTASVSIGNSVPGPNIGAAFSKSDNLEEFYVVTDDDGKILQHGAPLVDGPVDVEYTLRADLTRWNGSNGNFTLQRNVVITDTLPTTASWNTADSEFLTASGIALTEINPCPADFADNPHIGTYCVDGQTFRANIGKDNSTNATIRLKAQLHHVDAVPGMQLHGSSSVVGGERWRLRNTANFAYLTTGSGYNRTSDLFPTVIDGDDPDGMNDTRAFVKSSPTAIRVAPGEAAIVPFEFTMNTERAGFSPSAARIIDYVDTDVFDLGDDLSGATVSGSYDGTALDSSDFTLTLENDSDLVVQLNDSGIAKVDAAAAGGIWNVVLELRTYPLEGKATFEVTNRASVIGTVIDHTYWSEQQAVATSYGNEAEARKFIYDAEAKEFTSELPVKVNEQAEFEGSDIFVYQLVYIGHGSFTANIDGLDLVDTLPNELEFLGFLTADQVDDPANNAVAGPVDAGGNVLGTFVAASGDQPASVVLSQKPGTQFSYREPAVLYFAVRVTDATATVVNNFRGHDAVITPYGDPSIDIEKWSDEGATPEYDADGQLLNDGYAGDFDSGRGKSLAADTPQQINFTISNDGREALRDVVVTDQLTGGVGALTDLVCVFADSSTGTTWAGPFEPATQFDCTATLPGIGLGQMHSNTATVTAVGVHSGIEVDDEDPWNAHVKSFAVGDYVWVDSDRDGVQDDDEAPLAGVTVELLDENGEPIEGRVTVTDDRGRYFFDSLPAGTYQVRFTLTDEQGKRYRYTSLETGDLAAVDSNAHVSEDNRLVGVSAAFVLDESNTALTPDRDYEFFTIIASEGIDPTWDAGVVVRPENLVTPGGPAGAGPSLIATGGSPAAWAGLAGGIVVLLLGAAVVLLGRRRERQ